MFIFRHTGKRAPAYPANALCVSPEGVKQIGIPMGLLEETAEPNPPS